MRELTRTELDQVSGGEEDGWSVEVNVGFFSVRVSGDDSVQDMAAAVGEIGSDAYWAARDAMADFYGWAAAGWEFSARCGM